MPDGRNFLDALEHFTQYVLRDSIGDDDLAGGRAPPPRDSMSAGHRLREAGRTLGRRRRWRRLRRSYRRVQLLFPPDLMIVKGLVSITSAGWPVRQPQGKESMLKPIMFSLGIVVYGTVLTEAVPGSSEDFHTDVLTGSKPWTNLGFANAPHAFQFAIVSDNAGGPLRGHHPIVAATVYPSRRPSGVRFLCQRN